MIGRTIVVAIAGLQCIIDTISVGIGSTGLVWVNCVVDTVVV